jgi:predicted acylesterase/phospholipase RssA
MPQTPEAVPDLRNGAASRPKLPNRRTLLRSLAGSALAIAGAAAASGPALGASPDGFALNRRACCALVLSGGGARGAYEAGVIEGLARSAGVRDGEALPGVDFVIGTSIGAINGWFLATAQYSALRRAWQTVLDGIFDAGPIKDWIGTNIHLEQPPVVPFLFNTADICNMRAAYFYVSASNMSDAMTQSMTCSIEDLSGMAAVTQAAGSMLHDALYASIALPLLLDPIELCVGGVDGLFVDGGSCDNSAIDVARILAGRVNVVLVDPAVATFHPRNAVDAGLGSFNLLQRRALDASLRSAYFETAGKRLFERSATRNDQHTYLKSVFDVDLGIMRPATDLGTGYADFHDAAKLRASYQLGVEQATQGWSPYALPAA